MVANRLLLEEHFGLATFPDHDAQREILPGRAVLIITQDRAEIKTWGLRAPGRQGSVPYLSARAVSKEKHSGEARRCLIPATGFFERKSNRPYFIDLGTPVFAFAGLTVGRRVAIITCPTNRAMAGFNDRMPVILHRRDYERWLSDGAPRLLKPYVGKMVAGVLK
jgi:putative SOS response-associated peptidase YedK